MGKTKINNKGVTMRKEDMLKKYIIIYDKKLNELLYMHSGCMVGMKTVRYHLKGGQGNHRRIDIDLDNTDRYVYFESNTINLKGYSKHKKTSAWVDDDSIKKY